MNDERRELPPMGYWQKRSDVTELAFKRLLELLAYSTGGQMRALLESLWENTKSRVNAVDDEYDRGVDMWTVSGPVEKQEAVKEGGSA